MGELARETTTSPSAIDFDQAQANFYTAARARASARTSTWLDGEEIAGAAAHPRSPAADRRGGPRRARASTTADRKRYLGVVEERVRTGAHRLALAAELAARA